jgi:hypothetical protein
VLFELHVGYFESPSGSAKRTWSLIFLAKYGLKLWVCARAYVCMHVYMYVCMYVCMCSYNVALRVMIRWFCSCQRGRLRWTGHVAQLEVTRGAARILGVVLLRGCEADDSWTFQVLDFVVRKLRPLLSELVTWNQSWRNVLMHLPAFSLSCFKLNRLCLYISR